jgi:transposase
MIFANNITDDERQLLKNHYRQAECSLIRERAHAVILSDQKRTAADIALILMRSQETIRGWLNDFDKRRIAFIFHKYDGNNASKLTIKQKEEIKKTLSKPPSDQGLPKEFWDVPSLKEYVKGSFGVVYESERSYHYLLRFSGLSFKLPTPFDKRRDIEKINQRLKEIHQKIKPFLESNEWEVFAADETRLTFEAEIRRAWLKRNEKTVLKVNRDSQYQNFFGALNLKSQRAHTVRLGWQNQEEIIEALQEVSREYPGKKFCVIWDNATHHKGKLVKEALKKGNVLEHVHLINLPPYAPDVNPQEHVWEFGKDCISNDKVPDSFSETMLMFESSIADKSFDLKIPEFVLR